MSNFDPRSLGSLAIWLDAMDYSTLTFSGAAGATAWKDKSGRGNHFAKSGVATPQYSLASINSRPGIQCGANGGFGCQFDGPDISYSAASIFIVAQRDSGSGSDRLFTRWGNPPGNELLISTDNANNEYDFNYSATAAGSSQITEANGDSAAGTPVIIGYRYTGSVLEAWINGQMVGSVATTIYAATGQITSLGHSSSADVSSFGELQFHTSAYSISQYRKISAALSAKWGIALRG